MPIHLKFASVLVILECFKLHPKRLFQLGDGTIQTCRLVLFLCMMPKAYFPVPDFLQIKIMSLVAHIKPLAC